MQLLRCGKVLRRAVRSFSLVNQKMAEERSLEEMANSQIVKSLGEVATERFTCGGSILTPSKVQAAYLNKVGQWNTVAFPGLQDADILKLIESSSVASFGKGKETVTDKSYRDAYALEPEKFFTSFQLSDCGIIGEVRVSLVPDVLNIRAELYKMNVYSGPTGCFKAHVDTPRGGDMFGSLVVCLPSQFTGGSLVTRHQGQEVTGPHQLVILSFSGQHSSVMWNTKYFQLPMAIV